MLTDDEPVTSLPGQRGPLPLHEDAQTEARCGEELEVHRHPNEPSHETAYSDLPALQHSEALADHSHAALVKVVERGRRGIPNNAVVNQLCRITPLLHRYLSKPRQGFAILVKRRRIAHHKNLRVSGHSKIFLNTYPSGAIRFGVQPLACGRGCDARSPDDGFACDALARDYDTFRVDQIDAVSEPNFDAQLLKSLLRGLGKTLRIRGQDPCGHIDEHNSCGGRIDSPKV